jgi:hypothetical protein
MLEPSGDERRRDPRISKPVNPKLLLDAVERALAEEE